MRVWVALYIVLIIPAVTAQTFTFAGPEFDQYDYPIEYVSTEHPRLADMTFNVTGGDITRVRVNMTQLGPSAGIQTLQANECTSITNGLRCTITDIRLQPSQGNVVVPITVVTPDTQERQERSVSFTIDNTQPTVQSITSADGAVGPDSNVTIQMSDNTGSFNNGFVFFYVGSYGPYRVDTCEGNTCTSTYPRFQCSHGQTVELRVGSMRGVPTQDDAGNPANLQAGQSATTVPCDTEAPAVKNVTVTTDAADNNLLVEGARATINISIDETTETTATTNLSSLGGPAAATTTCTDGLCQFSFTVGVQGYAQRDITFTVQDAAGNKRVHTQSFEILRSTTNDGNFDDIWRVDSATTSPNTVNRKVLQYYPQTVDVRVQLSSGLQDATITNQEITQCAFKDTAAGVNYDQTASGTVSGFTVEVPQQVWNTEDDTLSMNCTLAHTSRVGNTVVEGTEADVVEFDIRLDNYPDVPARIENQLNASEQQRKGYRSFLQSAQRFTTLATGVCRTSQILSTAGATSSSAGGAICAAGNIPGLQAMKPVGEALVGTGEALGQTTQVIQNNIGKFCNFLTCDLTGLTDQAWNNVPGTSQLESAGFTKDQLMRPEDNIFASAATLCMPGVISNLQKAQQVRCEYERCLRQDALQRGMPVSMCESSFSYNKCSFWAKQGVRGALDLTGFSVYSELGNLVKELLTNPVAIGGSIASYAADSLGCQGNCEAKAICIAPRLVSTAQNALGLVNNIQAVSQSLSGNQNAGFCQYAQDAAQADLSPTLVEMYGNEADLSSLGASNFACTGNKCSDGTYIQEGDATRLVMWETDTGYAVFKDDAYQRVRVDDGIHLTSDTVDQSRLTGDVGYKTLRDDDPLYPDASWREQAKAAVQDEGQEPSTEQETAQEAARVNAELDQLMTDVELSAGDGHPFKGRFENDGDERTLTKWEVMDKIESMYPHASARLDEAELDTIASCIRGTSDACTTAEEDIENAVASTNVEPPSGPPRIGLHLERGLALGRLAELQWPSVTDNAYSNWINDKLSLSLSGEAARVCEASFDADVPEGARIQQASNRRVGMHLEAYRQEDRNEYEYKVTGTVAPPEEGTVTFDIELRGETSTTLVNDQSVSADGQAWARTTSNLIEHVDTSTYENVCYVISSTAEPYDELGSTFCNTVVVQE